MLMYDHAMPPSMTDLQDQSVSEINDQIYPEVLRSLMNSIFYSCDLPSRLVTLSSI